MTSDQVRAALGLLKKTIPDLAVTSHTGPDGGPVLVITGVDRDIADTRSNDPAPDQTPGFHD